MDPLASVATDGSDLRGRPDFRSQSNCCPDIRDAAEPSKAPVQTGSEAAKTAAALTYRRSERAAVLLETREGDVVTVKFKNLESAGLEVEHSHDGETLTEVELSARRYTRVAVLVDGNLNDAERAAINSVIDQAAMLANEFFAGNASKAFAIADALDVDAEQLATVALRLRARESVTYAAEGLGSAVLPPRESARVARVPERPDAADSPRATADSPRLAATHRDAASSRDAELTGAAPSPRSEGIADVAAPAPARTRREAPAQSLRSEVDLPTSGGPASSLIGALLAFLDTLIHTFDDADGDRDAAAREATPASLVEFSLKLEIFKSLVVSTDYVTAADAATAHAATTDAATAHAATVRGPVIEGLSGKDGADASRHTAPSDAAESVSSASDGTVAALLPATIDAIAARANAVTDILV